MPKDEPMRRLGISLSEVLISVSVIGILLAIALPSVQMVRESARRIQCQNNLRQILLATQSIHASEGALPSLYNGTSLTYPLREWDLFHTHSWRVPLLGHLEQTQLRNRLAWEALATSKENEAVAQTVVPTFVCPSGASPLNMGFGLRHGSTDWSGPSDEIPESDRYYVVRSDYDAMAGIQVLPNPMPPNADVHSVDFVRWGVWGWAVFDRRRTSGSQLTRYRRGRFSDVTDGLSNTIAVVERGGKPIDLLDGKPNITSENPTAYYPGQTGWSASNTFAWAINGDGIGVNVSNAAGIYSLHAGGANIAIADGSVQFLAETTDFETLVRLFGRSDGGLPQE